MSLQHFSSQGLRKQLAINQGESKPKAKFQSHHSTHICWVTQTLMISNDTSAMAYYQFQC